MLETSVVIINKLGLHARAAAKFVSHAARYGSDVRVYKGDHCVNGKSIMGVMALAAVQGTSLSLAIEGEDEEAMMQDLKQLILDRFGENE